MTEAPPPRWTTLRPFAVIGLVMGLLVWPFLIIGALGTSQHEGGGFGVIGAAGYIAGFMCTLIALMLTVFALFAVEPPIKRLARIGLLVVIFDIVLFLGVVTAVLATADWG